MATENSPHPMQPTYGFLRVHQVAALLAIGRSSVWKRCAEGKMPKPLKIGPRTTVWSSTEIYEYIEMLRNDGGSHE